MGAAGASRRSAWCSAFRCFMALALRHVDAVHAAVSPACCRWPPRWSARGRCASGRRRLLGLRRARLRAGDGFAAWQRRRRACSWPTLLLLAAVACAAVGYVAGARLSAQMPAEHVICWVLVLALPLTLPLRLLRAPGRRTPARARRPGAASPTSRVFSMWLGFFAWYRGLALGGTVRVSQVQLVQPFLVDARSRCRCSASGSTARPRCSRCGGRHGVRRQAAARAGQPRRRAHERAIHDPAGARAWR